MPAPSIHPGLQERVLPLSVKAWHQMITQGLAPKDAELIRGVIVEKMPKSIVHTLLANWLLDAIKSSAGTDFWVRKEDPLMLADSEPEPDISVVPGRPQDYADHPTTARLVVEVAVSTLPEDRAMGAIYAESGVGEFWIVDAAGKSLEVFREPKEGRYQVKEIRHAGEHVVCASVPGVRVAVDDLFAAAVSRG